MSREARSAPWRIGKAAQAVGLSPASVTVDAGASETITATFLGEGTLSAVSSDPSVATVSVSGNVITVSGVAAGSVTITANVSEGTNYLSGSATASAEVEESSPVLFSTLSPLEESRSRLSGASTASYAIFAGGFGYRVGLSAYKNTVDAYDVALTRVAISYTSFLGDPRSDLGGASADGTAVFFGGNDGSITNQIDSYNDSLVHTNPTPRGSLIRSSAAASVGVYAVFCGGYSTGTAYVSNICPYIVAFNKALTVSFPTQLSTPRSAHAGISIGDRAIFAGGYYNESYLSSADAYDASLVRFTPTGLSAGRSSLASANAGNYALFAGGIESDGYTRSRKVDVYDQELTRTTAIELSTGRAGLVGASTGNYAVFSRDVYSDSCDVYSPELTKTTVAAWSGNYSGSASAKVGKSALFAGGQYDTSTSIGYTNSVFAYTEK